MAITLDGTTGTTTPNVVLPGSASGTITLAAPSAAGTQSYTLPSAVPAANGYALTATTAGVMSWSAVSVAAATPTALGTVYANTPGAAGGVGLGYQALASNTATTNTGIGYQALFNVVNASNNVAIGYQALLNQTTVVQNTAVGSNAGSAVTTGTGTEGNCVFVGYSAGSGVTTGYRITAIGSGAGSTGTALTTGNACTYVGWNAQASGASVTNELVVSAASSVGKGSSTGYINAGGGGTYQGNNSAAWSVTSDQRLKKNIVDNNVGLDAINAVKVRNFEYRLPEEVDSELNSECAIIKEGTQLGVIAQELQAVLPDCVKQESTGVLSVDSDPLTWYMVNAIKQLSTKLDVANTTIQELTARVAALEAK